MPAPTEGYPLLVKDVYPGISPEKYIIRSDYLIMSVLTLSTYRFKGVHTGKVVLSERLRACIPNASANLNNVAFISHWRCYWSWFRLRQSIRRQRSQGILSR